MKRRVASLGVAGFFVFVAPMLGRAAVATPDYAFTLGVPAADGRSRWTAENPAQGLVATFGDTGVRVEQTAAPEAASLLTLRLVAWGWKSALGAPEPPEIVSDGARLECRRGSLTEWYVNAREGLEQGFTIAAPPAQAGGGDVLEVRMAFGGTLAPQVDEDRDGLTLVDAEGEARLSYSGLVAWDATGRELPASLEEREAGGVAILVRAEGAAWPIVVDPVIATQEAQLFASDAAMFDNFGCSVSLCGETALVGANGDDHDGGPAAGSAYVFARSGTTWKEQAKLIASDAAGMDYFGFSVSLCGETALVGAFGDDHAGGMAAGSAYVFVRTRATWTEQTKLIAADAATSDLFGSSVSLSGDTALVGAPGDDHYGSTNAGSAYVFVRSGTTWTQQAKLKAADATIYDGFGSSVSVSGETALVGCPSDDHGVTSNAGSAYVFIRNGATWTEQAKLIAADAAHGDGFGGSVSLFGDTALVGACYDDKAGWTDAGAAYVFIRSGTTWTQQAKLTAGDAANTDGFGYSVSLSSDTALIGACQDDHGGGMDAGSAYVFLRCGTTWTEQAKLIAADATSGDGLGRSVSLSGDRALVGAPGSGPVFSGSAYAFRLETCGTAAAYGAGCAGSGGFAPALALTGCPAPTQVVQLSLTEGLGGSLALFLFGGGQASVPIGGGCTFLLSPVLPLQSILPLGGAGPGNGSIVLPGTVCAGAAGHTFTTQAAVLDAASPLGFSLTNGVLVQVVP
ncbi:MAG: FG-GAP repeat protein [Planctomycetes bacterium]|nr:FG-GAP repeat protein [Planctomycetota bacterium]